MSTRTCLVSIGLAATACFSEPEGPSSTTADTATDSASDDTGSATSTSTAVDGSETASGEVCGDGIVGADEECDDGNTEVGDGCHSDCTEYKLVFLTANPTNGGLDGLDGADMRCRMDAAEAGVEGDFLAWLSTADSSPVDRMQPANMPYRRVDGVAVAEHWGDLVDGMLAAPIDRTAAGGIVDAAAVWTGTAPSGMAKGQSCANWTSALPDASGRSGLTSFADARWTDVADQFCSLSARMYCIQQ